MSTWFYTYAFHMLELDTPILESLQHYHIHFQQQVAYWRTHMHQFPWDRCDDPALLLALVRTNGDYLHHVPRTHLTPELCLAAVESSFRALESVPDTLRTRELYEVIMRVYSNGILSVPLQYHTRDCWLSALQRQQGLLYFVSDTAPELLYDSEICLAAVCCSGIQLQWIPAAAQTLEICIAAVAHDTSALRYVCDVTLRPDVRAAARNIRMARAHPEPAQLHAAQAAHAYHMQLRAARNARLRRTPPIACI